MTAKPIFELLTQDSREKIIQQSFSLLEEQGVDVNSPKALECLIQAGCTADGVRVKIPRKLVKTSIESAPSVIKIYDRNGKEAMDLGKQNTYFGPGPTCPNFFDAYTGERRKAVKNDAALAAVLTDALPNIDFAMSLCMIGDKTKELADIHEIDAMIRNTTKPLVGWAFNARNLQIIIDMCAVTAGSLEALQEKPFIIIYSEPTTPFVHSRDALEKLMLLAENNIPCVYTPGMIMGATAPVTVAGALSVGLCECLTGLVLSQAVRKGAPFIGGAPGGPMDMKTMQHSYGAPEWVLLHSASVEVFHALDLPVFTAAGASDSKTVDAQSAAEAMLQIIGALGTGGNLIHDVGFMDLGMTGSPLHLVICDELIGMARRMMEGVPVDEEHLAREVIEDVGPGGNFLSEEHTFEFFRDEIWNPSLMDRHTYKDWQKAGSKTMTKRAQDKMLELLQTHRPKLLQDAILKKLDQLVETAEQDFTGNPL